MAAMAFIRSNAPLEITMTTYYSIFESPIGPLLLTSDGTNITRLYMNDHEGGPTANADFAESKNHHAKFGSLPLREWQKGDDQPIIRKARKQIEEFFDGKRQSFELPLAPEGSEFQRAVWKELTRIPFGKTISYGELAKRIG